MRFGRLDIPDEIIDAQGNGELVIFPGAGISIDQPAGRPNFEALTKEIGRNSGIDWDEENNEPLDQYLGRLENAGIEVHSDAARILTEGAPQPNQYHLLIPQLFHEPEELRIVTTNQDILLIDGLKENGKDIQVFRAPALPDGDDFEGLVFLHGNVLDPRRMVLTDANFSQAYLTKGWARKFLIQLFNKYTVLFIGYSHDDIVLRYLARGLPSGSGRRFLLTHEEGENARWRHLGIEPILYEKPKKKGESHNNLIEGLQAWGKYTAMGRLQHRSRIIELAESVPPVNDEDIDYLKRQLCDSSSVRVFTDRAKRREWLEWIAERGFLESLFLPELIENDRKRETSRIWAYWLAEMGIGEGYIEALSIVRRQVEGWNNILWFAVARELHYHNNIPHDRFNNWTKAFLAAPIPLNGSSHYLGYALMKCQPRERKATALLLFDRMTHPTPGQRGKVESGYEEDYVNVRWEAVFPEDDYYLRKAWSKLFVPNLDRLSEQILPIAEANLSLSYEITQPKPDDFDSFNVRQYSIADHEDNQIRFNKVIDTLIIAIRDCLRWLIVQRLDEGISIARRYLQSERALFPRIALHVLTETVSASPDDLIKWILDANLVRPEAESAELSLFLQRFYPRASDGIRISLLNRIDERYEK